MRVCPINSGGLSETGIGWRSGRGQTEIGDGELGRSKREAIECK